MCLHFFSSDFLALHSSRRQCSLPSTVSIHPVDPAGSRSSDVVPVITQVTCFLRAQRGQDVGSLLAEIVDAQEEEEGPFITDKGSGASPYGINMASTVWENREGAWVHTSRSMFGSGVGSSFDDDNDNTGALVASLRRLLDNTTVPVAPVVGAGSG